MRDCKCIQTEVNMKQFMHSIEVKGCSFHLQMLVKVVNHAKVIELITVLLIAVFIGKYTENRCVSQEKCFFV